MHIKACSISKARTEKRSMIALNAQNLQNKMGGKKQAKAAKAEAQQDQRATLNFFVRMLKEEGEESEEEVEDVTGTSSPERVPATGGEWSIKSPDRGDRSQMSNSGSGPRAVASTSRPGSKKAPRQGSVEKGPPQQRLVPPGKSTSPSRPVSGPQQSRPMTGYRRGTSGKD